MYLLDYHGAHAFHAEEMLTTLHKRETTSELISLTDIAHVLLFVKLAAVC